MIKIGIETKFYKMLEIIFVLLKLNLYMFIFGLGFVGLPSSFITGFYFFNRYVKKGYDIQFKEFKNEFLENFKKSIYLCSPPLAISYILYFYFNFTSYIFVPIVGYIMILFMTNSLVKTSLKNTYVLGMTFFVKNISIILILNLSIYYVIKSIIRFIPGLLIYFNYLMLIIFYHFVFSDKFMINYKNYLREKLDES
ncbi:MAG: hypothetical protein ACRDAQ_10400 [Cetobacterium sp.]